MGNMNILIQQVLISLSNTTVMTQFENSQQRQNLGENALTSLDSRGFEWHKRVLNLLGNYMGRLNTTQWTL